MSNATVPPMAAVHCRHPGPFNNTTPSRSTPQLYHHSQLQLPLCGSGGSVFSVLVFSWWLSGTYTGIFHQDLQKIDIISR
uniref:Uncharacterized protein n=1 Tax=Triticum urartu TaxID=4572 RepID=A0A8R7TZT9_TRIUA